MYVLKDKNINIISSLPLIKIESYSLEMDEEKHIIEYSFSSKYHEQFGDKHSNEGDSDSKLMLENLGLEDKNLSSDNWFSKSIDVSRYLPIDGINPILPYLSPTQDSSSLLDIEKKGKKITTYWSNKFY